MKVGSMFAGIGGICLGFKQAGAEIIWANEIDCNACITYRSNFGDSYLVEDDIYKVDTDIIPEMDILTAGFPCQAFSIAGHRKGFDDERGVLFHEVMRVVRDKRPRGILLENVKNLMSHDNGNTYHIIKGLLVEEGYSVKEKVLNTMDYGNVPQNRERIYVVAFRNEDGGINPDMDRFQFPEPVELTSTIHDIVDIHTKVDEYYYYRKDHIYYDRLNEAMVNPDTVYQWRRVYVRENKSNVCPTLTANMGGGGHNVPIIRDDYGIRKLTPHECFMFQGFPREFILPESMARSHLYKQAGNSVSVPVIKRIAENMMKAMGSVIDV